MTTNTEIKFPITKKQETRLTIIFWLVIELLWCGSLYKHEEFFRDSAQFLSNASMDIMILSMLVLGFIKTFLDGKKGKVMIGVIGLIPFVWLVFFGLPYGFHLLKLAAGHF